MRLERWRIYILPTRAGLLFGLALFTMLLAAINYGLALGFALTFLLASVGLVSMLHDETEDSCVRVAALQPGPMRTSIRARAYVEEAATDCPEAAVYAPACVHLLSAAGIAERGRILRPDPVR